MTPPVTLDAQFVTEHQDFLRRLARSLLGPSAEHDVDDAVQDTWRAALEDAPAHSPRGYLAAVLRHRLLRTRTRERARAGVEARGARGETIEVDVERHLALQEELTRALRALSEPQRTALFLRFDRGLSLAAIAAHTGAPIPTVKTRITRGLRAMRAELDARHGGARDAWATTLISATLPSTATAARAAGAWSFVASLAGATLAAVLLLVLARTWFEGAPATSLTRTLPAATLSEGHAAAEPTPPSSGRLPASAALSGPRTSRPTPVHPPTPFRRDPDVGTARVRARLLDRDANPLAGVPVQLDDRVNSGAALFELGARPDLPPLDATSDIDGVIELTFPAYGCLSWTLQISPQLHAHATRRWAAPNRDTLVDLGDIALEPPATRTVTVADPSGEAVTAPFSVWASERLSSQALRNESFSASATTVAGIATFTNLPPRRFSLQATGFSAPLGGSLQVELEAGEARQVVLLLREPHDANRITAGFHPTLRGVAPTTGMTLTAATGEVVPPERVDESNGRVTWRGEPSLLYSLEFAADGFEPWSCAGLQAGEGAFVETQPRSGVRLTLTAANGAPLGLEGGVNVGRLRVSDFSGFASSLGAASTVYAPDDVAPLHLHRTPLQPGAEFKLPPGDHTLAVFGPNVRRVDVTIAALAPNELRDVHVATEPTRTIAGTVSAAHGAPDTGIIVELLAAAARDDGRASDVLGANAMATQLSRWRRELAHSAVGPDGRFEFRCGETGPLIVRAWRSGRLAESPEQNPFAAPYRPGFSSALVDAVEVSIIAGAAPVDIALTLPSEVRVSGTLAGFAASTHGAFELVLRRTEAIDGPGAGQGVMTPRSIECLRVSRPGPSGAFEFDGVTPGEHDLVALLGDQPYAAMFLPRPTLVLARLQVPPGGLTDVVVTPSTPLPEVVDVRVQCTDPSGVPVPGALLGSLVVFAHPAGEPATSEQLAVRCIDGSAKMPIVGRTGRWRIVVHEPELGWAVPHEVELSASATSFPIDIALAAGTLSVVDSTGAPRSGVSLRPAHPQLIEVRLGHRGGVRTSSDGRATLWLPVGEATFASPRNDNAVIGPFPWPPAPGTEIVAPD